MKMILTEQNYFGTSELNCFGWDPRLTQITVYSNLKLLVL